MTAQKPIAKGDKLIWVRSLDTPESKTEIVVEKVGSKWLTIMNGWREWRADINTLEVNSDRGWGYCFRSEEELSVAVDKYRKSVAAEKAWDKLVKKMRGGWRRPEHLTEESILQAMKILGWGAEK